MMTSTATITSTSMPHQVGQEEAPAMSSHDQAIHVMCERWVNWQRTRRLYGPKPITGTVLGRLSGTSTRPLHPDGPDAISSAELSAFHIAYTCQPDAIDKQAFDLYYLRRAKPVKTVAGALGVSRQHFHRMVNDFRRRVAHAADAIAAENQQQLQAMIARRAARSLDAA